MIAPVAGRAAAGKAAARAGTSKRAAAGAPGTAGAPRGAPPSPDKAANDLLSGMPGGFKKAGAAVTDAAGKLTLTPPRRLRSGDVAGFLMGLVLYALAINGIKHGPAGIRGWIAAKFLNKPMGSE